MLKVLSNILCDLDPKVKAIGQKAGICDGVPSTSALVVFVFIHQDNHFIQNILTKQCCLLIMSSVHFKIFSRIISSCKQTL